MLAVTDPFGLLKLRLVFYFSQALAALADERGISASI